MVRLNEAVEAQQKQDNIFHQDEDNGEKKS